MTRPYWHEFHPVEPKNNFAVKSLFSEKYTILQEFSEHPDAGIPWQENLIREVFSKLAALEVKNNRLSQLRFAKRKRNAVIYEELTSIVWKLCTSSEAFRSAITRLERHLPKDHHWRKYAEKFAHMILEDSSK